VTVLEQDVAGQGSAQGAFQCYPGETGPRQEFLGSRILPFGLPADSDLLKTWVMPVSPQRSSRMPG